MIVENIRSDAGPMTVLRAMRVLTRRLLAHPETKDLAPDVAAKRDAVRAALDVYEERHDELLALSGAVDFADAVEDEAIGDLSRKVKVEIRNDLKDRLWRKLFAEAPSKTTRGVANEAQTSLAKHLIGMLKEDPACAVFSACLPGLEAARAAVVAALAAETAAGEAEDRAWTELQLAEDDARAAYRDMEHELSLRFPGQPRLVDSFFYQPAKSKRKVRDDEEPAT